MTHRDTYLVRGRLTLLLMWAIATGVLGVALLAPSAYGHTYRKNDTSNCPFDADKCPKEFYFYGATQNGDGDRLDPINVIFAGGFSPGFPCYGTTLSPGCATVHMLNDSDLETIPRACNGNQFVVYRHIRTQEPRTSTVGRDSALNSKSFPCSTQFHIRFWSDHKHQEYTDHGAADQFTLASIHHERRGDGGKHKPDKDWIDVRAWLRRQMAEHCSRRRWAFHPGAAPNYQGRESDGIILRISASHVADARGGQKPHRCRDQ